MFQMIFFFRGPKSPTAANTCSDEMKDFKGRDTVFVSDWLTNNGFKSCLQRNFGCVIRL